MKIRDKVKVNGAEVLVLEGDITELDVDALVNPANTELLMEKGLAKIVRQKGGEIIQREASRKAPVEPGQAIVTTAGRLKARYIIHAAITKGNLRTDENKIRSACASALKIAKKLRVGSIAFPALGACGLGRFPYEASAKIMSQEVFKYFRENANRCLKKIFFALLEKRAYAHFRKNVLSYLEYIQGKIRQGPFCTVDVIIQLNNGIVLVKRKNPPFGWAIPGGFVDYGEPLEEAACREAKEETGLSLRNLRQFHTYSCPERDPRFHTVSTVFIAKAKGKPKAATDAAAIHVFDQKKLPKELAFDHAQILRDYLLWKKTALA
jgi:ADP-ribose pyrophosphatase YjhB (NUDIX family)/O-acetyl-ADP-ribose deacetylase (regulator of RNase III)